VNALNPPNITTAGVTGWATAAVAASVVVAVGDGRHRNVSAAAAGAVARDTNTADFRFFSSSSSPLASDNGLRVGSYEQASNNMVR